MDNFQQMVQISSIKDQPDAERELKWIEAFGLNVFLMIHFGASKSVLTRTSNMSLTLSTLLLTPLIRPRWIVWITQDCCFPPISYHF